MDGFHKICWQIFMWIKRYQQRNKEHGICNEQFISLTQTVRKYYLAVHTFELFDILLKGTWIQFQYLFLMENSILYAKIAVSEKIFFSKLSFKYYIGLLFSYLQ